MKNRAQILATACLREFDLIVVGGGISGAAATLDAASRGLSVLLIDKGDFASGSSSRTNKRLHINSSNFQKSSLTKNHKLFKERSLLTQLAPQLVRDFYSLLPLKKQAKLANFKAKLGLTISDLMLGSYGRDHPHQRLSKKELQESARSLSGSDFIGAVRFYDCQIDDARLTIELLKTASTEGGEAINYLEVKGVEKEGNVTFLTCHDRYSGEECRLRCQSVLVAAGVWTEEIFKMADSNWLSRFTVLKQTHAAMPLSSFETNNALFLPAEAGSFITVMPWQRALIVSAAQSIHGGELSIPAPKPEEIAFLLAQLNKSISSRELTANDIIASWSSLSPVRLRPNQTPNEKRAQKLNQKDEEDQSTAKHTESSSNSSNSSDASADATRITGLTYEDVQAEIIEGPLNMLGIISGSLINFRLTAEAAIDKVISQANGQDIDLAKSDSRTKTIMLGGWKNKNDYLTLTAEIAAKARKLGLEPATLDHLIGSYGADSQVIVNLVEREPALKERICPDFPQIMAEVVYCISQEMVVSLEDVLLRRMRLGFLHQMQCKEAAARVASLMQNLLNWNDERAALELQALENTLNAHIDSFVALINDDNRGNDKS
jgi:glycerol-3-phosphate dehydrogenase